jgi:acetyl esterase/lipase
MNRFREAFLGSVTAAAAAIFVHGGFLNAQTTTPLDLLRAAAPPGERIPYGRDPFQFGELRVPDGPGNHPVAILIHGGCWLAKLGQLPEAATSLELLRPMALALEANGIATWNVEYRRLGNPGGGWPGTFEDVGQATDLVRELARTRHLDLSRVVLVGHSSGGHLALWVAARHKLPATSPLHRSSPLAVAGVVNIDAPPDLESIIPMERQVCGEPIVERLLGGTAAELPARYREASATGLLPIGTKQALLIADKHTDPWINAIKSYAALAIAAGDVTTVTMMKDAGHFDGLNAKTSAWDAVLASIRSAISR